MRRTYCSRYILHTTAAHAHRCRMRQLNMYGIRTAYGIHTAYNTYYIRHTLPHAYCSRLQHTYAPHTAYVRIRTSYADGSLQARSPTEGLSRSGGGRGAYLARAPDGQWMDGNISLTTFRDSERARESARASERARGRHPMEESTLYNPANSERVSQRGSNVSTDVAYLQHRRSTPTDVPYLAGFTGFTGFTTGKLAREPGILKLDFC